MKILSLNIVFILNIGISSLSAQSVVDSLAGKSFDYLINGHLNTENTEFQDIYANAIIKKAKTENHSNYLVEGYYMKAYIYFKDEEVLNYCDSIISLTQDNSNKLYPALAYLAKSKYYYKKRDFKKALDNSIESLHFSKKHNDKFNISNSNLLIGVLKSRMGENEQAKDILKKNYYYAIENRIEKDILPSIFALSNIYIKLKKIDSASFYSDIGYKKSLKKKNLKYRSYFRLSKGVAEYHKTEYYTAQDSIKKALFYLKKLDNKPNMAVGYYYLAKIHEALGNDKEKLVNLKKVDTIFRQTGDVLPKLRDGYEMLISHYKKHRDLENQLIYINQLIKLDSVLHSNEVYVKSELIEKYDIPKLVSEKEEIINILENKDQKKTLYLSLLAFLTVLISIMFYYQYQKKKVYKKRFLELMNQREKKTSKDNIKLKKSIVDETSGLNISEEVVNTILERLKEFENGNLFLSSEITSNKLADQIDTNVKYLSNVINSFKHKTFITYINDLRVNYAIEKLKIDDNFRKYTIVAIANEVGFKKAESFSRAFKKHTNITPNFFIKELAKNPKFYPNSRIRISSW